MRGLVKLSKISQFTVKQHSLEPLSKNVVEGELLHAEASWDHYRRMFLIVRKPCCDSESWKE